MSRHFEDRDYIMPGNVLEAIWRSVYTPLIEDDGTPEMAIKGDRRRDIAQLLGALLDRAEG